MPDRSSSSLSERDCEHGRLARSCEVCDLLDELEDVRENWRTAMRAAAKWQRAFNSIEKPVTRHIENCIDCDDLERAHRAVMREYGPRSRDV